jgi:predicted phage terminase large subunit-like protein
VLEKLDDELVALSAPDSDVQALAVFVSPQEGKSQRVSRRYAEWLLDHNPALRIAIVSYELDSALRWGRDIKMDIAQHPCQGGPGCDNGCGGLHISIRHDSAAAGRWETPEGGGIYCVGVGGPLTGKPADYILIDDPVKGREEAESSRFRDRAWDWWESVALTRLAPASRVVLIQTRWNEGDLAGRILSRPSPLKWKTLRIPAIADSADDPLGRAIGEEMPSVRNRPPGHFHHLRATMSPYVFSGIYQQAPAAAEGNFFRRASFRYWRHMEPWADGRERIFCEGQAVTLVDCWKFITMDFAASTKNSADYTVAACWGVTPAGDLILLDRERERIPDHEHFEMAQRLRLKWNADQVYVESNWWSKTFVSDARDKGVPVAKVTADLDKVTRAIPAAGRVHSGRVWFPAEVAWLDEWCDELAIFPQGSHDDQVDTLSYAARIQVNEWVPAHDEPRPGRDPWEQSVYSASAAATGGIGGHAGDGGGDLDILNVPY